MPSPIGHALGGLAAGWPAVPTRNVRAAIALGLVAAAPDLDLLLGEHREWSHSIGAALIAGLVAFALTRRPRWGAAVSLAWTSHVLLDWLGTDTRPPVGVMALWPLTHAYYQSNVHVFPAISRRYWLPEFWFYNAKALLVEVAILLPPAWIAVTAFRRRGR
jgi:membrane-bound metal-dependent hydrolase YbcI (DUF457 family)